MHFKDIMHIEIKLATKLEAELGKHIHHLFMLPTRTLGGTLALNGLKIYIKIVLNGKGQ